jgi:hypothetical protein
MLLLAAGLAATLAKAQEIVTLQTRPGVTQSFFIANMGGRKAEVAACFSSAARALSACAGRKARSASSRATSCRARGVSSSATASFP